MAQYIHIYSIYAHKKQIPVNVLELEIVGKAKTKLLMGQEKIEKIL